MAMSKLTEPIRRGACPICAKPLVDKFRPFCSRRCADVDLNRWLSGLYAVPAVEAEGDVESASAQAVPRTGPSEPE
jgi:hypothetical protein